MAAYWNHWVGEHVNIWENWGPETVTGLRRHSRTHINIKNPVVPSLPLRINTRKPESVAERGLFCLLFCSQCGCHRNRTRPTWHFSWDCQLPMLRGRMAAAPPTKVSAVVENVSGKQMCPKITGVISGRWELKKIFLFKKLWYNRQN